MANVQQLGYVAGKRVQQCSRVDRARCGGEQVACQHYLFQITHFDPGDGVSNGRFIISRRNVPVAIADVRLGLHLRAWGHLGGVVRGQPCRSVAATDHHPRNDDSALAGAVIEGKGREGHRAGPGTPTWSSTCKLPVSSRHHCAVAVNRSGPLTCSWAYSPQATNPSVPRIQHRASLVGRWLSRSPGSGIGLLTTRVWVGVTAGRLLALRIDDALTNVKPRAGQGRPRVSPGGYVTCKQRRRCESTPARGTSRWTVGLATEPFGV